MSCVYAPRFWRGQGNILRDGDMRKQRRRYADGKKSAISSAEAAEATARQSHNGKFQTQNPGA